jgi:predicted metal-dependent hydrolase
VKRKSDKIAAVIEPFQGQDLDAHYLGFFACFNQQRFYEAHEILEELWLVRRRGPDGPFYKGLIQLAGAFVHLQKRRPQPAAALLKLAQANLERYLPTHGRLELTDVLRMIQEWLQALESGDPMPEPAPSARMPRLLLQAMI